MVTDFIFFFENNALSLAISAVVSVAFWLVFKFFGSKIPHFIQNYAPMLTAFILSVAFDMIFISKAFTLSESGISAGLLTASFTVVFTVFIKRTEQGENPFSDISEMLIEGLLFGFVDGENLGRVSCALLDALDGVDDAGYADNARREEITRELIGILDEYLNREISDGEKSLLISTILSAVESLKREK